MKQKNKIISLAVITIIIALFGACDKNKKQVTLPPPITNAPELITSVVLKFTDTANVVSIFEFRDPDGEGGNPPVKFDTIKLSSNRSYSLEVLFLDETKNPIDTISEEIWEERDDHQLFFTHEGTGVTTTYLDVDNNGYPVGLTTKWQTGNPTNGKVKVVLKHQPGIKSNSANAGETDVEVLFPISIQ